MAEKQTSSRRDLLKVAAVVGIGFAIGSWAVALSRGKAVVEVTSQRVEEVRVKPQV
ncbi:twin-arginine translocation signal domain-containing protein [Pyrobaculum aerophilum]|uniref:twin-arginine translocation signal domain-containing protein n=1 Tax=Pyrobaculum aerophilum TaxID=13773 RepID=UPI0023F09A43|nr:MULTISPECIES: twin-arginine translocation signal domain-containing protein [Pyrobaculum]MCX8137124.1 twin-arginine translocation signal domain-containing protein [Pyrobaculum aerophilum]